MRKGGFNLFGSSLGERAGSILDQIEGVRKGLGKIPFWNRLPVDDPLRPQKIDAGAVWEANLKTLGLADITDPNGPIFRVFQHPKVLDHVSRGVRDAYKQERPATKGQARTHVFAASNTRFAAFEGCYYNPWRTRKVANPPAAGKFFSWEGDEIGWYTDSVMMAYLPKRPAIKKPWTKMDEVLLSERAEEWAAGPWEDADILAEAYMGTEKTDASKVLAHVRSCANPLQHWFYSAHRMDFLLTTFPGAGIKFNTAMPGVAGIFPAGSEKPAAFIANSTTGTGLGTPGTISAMPTEWTQRYQKLFEKEG